MDTPTPITLRPWNSLYDGFMSVAKEIVNLKVASNNFEKTSYVGQYEFYDKYLAYYNNLIDILEDKMVHPEHPEVDLSIEIKCITRISQRINELIDDRKATLHSFLIAYTTVIAAISALDFGRPPFSHKVPYTCNYIEDETQLILDDMVKRSMVVPFISPRGVFGANTFLYMYFNDLFPIGITLNPWNVHYGTFHGNPIATIIHDNAHVGEYNTFYHRPGRDRYKRIYSYIVHNQDKFGHPGKVKGYILYLFYLIHEMSDFSIPGDHEEIVKDIICITVAGGLSDALPFLIENTYYNYEYLGFSEAFFQKHVVGVNEELSMGEPFDEEEGVYDDYRVFDCNEIEHPYVETINYISKFFYSISDDFVPLYETIE